MNTNRTTPTATKLTALTLSSIVALGWLSAVVLGMQEPADTAIAHVELPRVVVVGHRATASDVEVAGKAAADKPV
jgi:hypothetical protein